MILTGENRSTWSNTCLSATLPTITLTWTGLESKSGLRGDRQAVAQSDEALRYKPEGRGFDFSLTDSFRPHYSPGIDSLSNRNEYQEYFLWGVKAVGTMGWNFYHLFWHSEDRASRYILTIKTNEMDYFSKLFWCRTLHVSDRVTVHHQESSTVYTA